MLPLRSLSLAFLGALCAGCPESVVNPPAFDSERYLCGADSESLWQAELDKCQEMNSALADSCSGVISFEGILEGQHVVVDDLLSLVTFETFTPLEGPRLMKTVRLDGMAPYFFFRLTTKSLGGVVEASDSFGAGARNMTSEKRVREFDDDGLSDLIFSPSLRWTSASVSTDLSAEQGGTITVMHQTDSELVAEFDLSFGTDGDNLSGCFHAFKTAGKNESEQAPSEGDDDAGADSSTSDAASDGGEEAG